MISARHAMRLIKRTALKKTIRQFAQKYNLVYFGRVDSRSDEHELVRGLTVSTSHTDNHYSVGTIQGHDIILVERHNTVTFPGKPDSRYAWLILQIDLKRSALPHIFLDAHHHDETFYANMRLVPGQFMSISPDFMHYDPQFAAHFTIMTPIASRNEALQLLIGPIATTLGAHFKQFDYEINDDQLLVYASNAVITPALLNEALRAGLWLAGELDHVRPTS